MSLSVGDKLGPYEILGPLGAGGMGEVWKARDLRLGRIVAIKVSQGNFTDRFEREAKAVAALNHPNVCQLYDVGSTGGAGHLVMELVEGSPIAAADSLRKLLDLAVQIADGLTAAHALSIVHRDLKPDNILVTRDGRVKILDFGLARQAAAAAGAGDVTQTMSVTDPGTTVGSVNYMSPEQARGEKDLTPQSDQFSFGLVLYELSTGKRPFRRGSAAETMAAIIREEAEPLPTSVPAPLRWVIERLLAKEPSERYDSTRDLYRELKHIRDRLSESVSAVQTVPPAAVPRRKRLLVPLVAGIACMIAGAVGAALLLPQSSDGPHLENYKYTFITRDGAEHRFVRWSPDGQNIAYTARVNGRMQVFTRLLDGADAVQLSKAGHDCSAPFWSPDGATVYYVSGGNLWSIPAAGGAAQTVLEGVGSAALHPDGKTVAFERGGNIWMTRSFNSSQAREFWQGPVIVSFGFSFSPDGSKLAVPATSGLWLLPYPSGTPRKLETGGILTWTSWFPDSRHLLVAIQGTGEGTLSILDVVDGARRTVASASPLMNYPAVSPDGKRIAYTSGLVGWDVIEVSIPGGEVRTLVSGGAWWPDWAPAGTHFIYSVPIGRSRGIEDRQPGEEGFSRLLVEGLIGDPRWSPDGKRIVFSTQVGRTSKLKMVNASGGGAVILNADPYESPEGMSWSPDGLWISYLGSARGKTEVVKIRAAPAGVPVALTDVSPQANLRLGTRWSPAGDWIAYPSAGGIDLISPDGKSTRTLTTRAFAAYGFSREGSQIYGIFQNTTGQGGQWQLFSVNVKTGAERFLAPVDLPASADSLAGFSIHPDGRRFLTSFSKFPFDIWMLEGFPPPRPRTLLDRLLHR